MSGRRLALVTLSSVTVLLLVPPSAGAQAQGKPAGSGWAAKTPWGHPDLQGTYTNNTVVPLERPANLADKAELTDAEVADRFERHRDTLFARRQGDTGFYNDFWFEWGKDGNRTSLIVDPPDGKLPIKPEAQKRDLAAMIRFSRPTSAEDFNAFDRCITRSLPGAMMPGFYNHYYQILQTPDHVVIHVEMIHDVRIIPLGNRPHLGPSIRQWLGDSRGRWEGNTLVVETTNLSEKVIGRSLTYFGLGPDSRLIERFTRVDADTIDYRFTVEAAASFDRQWTAAIPLQRSDLKIYEYACHEGNYAMPNSLSGARAEEAKKAAKP
jgi:hypothetical protein